MTELSFLIDLLLNEKLTKTVKVKVKDRVKFVEESLAMYKPIPWPPNKLPVPIQTPVDVPEHLKGQAPSTIAAFMRHQAEAGNVPLTQEAMAAVTKPEQPTLPGIISTAPALAAINNREQQIANAINGKGAQKNRGLK